MHTFCNIWVQKNIYSANKLLTLLRSSNWASLSLSLSLSLNAHWLSQNNCCLSRAQVLYNYRGLSSKTKYNVISKEETKQSYKLLFECSDGMKTIVNVLQMLLQIDYTPGLGIGRQWTHHWAQDSHLQTQHNYIITSLLFRWL